MSTIMSLHLEKEKVNRNRPIILCCTVNMSCILQA